MNVQYFCSGCSYKTANVSALINTGKGGCRSCGKSGYKCPNCGMMMKMRRLSKSVPYQQLAKAERVAKVKSHVQTDTELVRKVRTIKINKIR
jgi:hypothetical protein